MPDSPRRRQDAEPVASLVMTKNYEDKDRVPCPLYYGIPQTTIVDLRGHGGGRATPSPVRLSMTSAPAAYNIRDRFRLRDINYFPLGWQDDMFVSSSRAHMMISSQVMALKSADETT